jgi:glutamine synthetase
LGSRQDREHMTASNEVVQELMQSLQQSQVKYAVASYVDMHGVPRAKMVPIAHLPRMMDGSELFTGAALDGVPQSVHEEEVAAMPDPASCAILPWKPDVAWFASDLWCRGEAFEPCSRNILRRAVARANALGLYPKLGVESEFFVLEAMDDGSLQPVSDRDRLPKPCYDAVSLIDSLEWMGPLVEGMNSLGWDVYSFDHEDAPGQFEVDSHYTDMLAMADRFVLMRVMANEFAKQKGYFVTWMPKPFSNRTGSGAHFNMSLADAQGNNLFAPGDDPKGVGVTELGYQFIAGILSHLPALSAVVSPTVNSYKRIVKQGSMDTTTWAPVYRAYGGNNRTNTLRIPKSGGRVELRQVDPSCNPYLAAAMVLTAGLEGVGGRRDPGPPNLDNLYDLPRAERERRGIRELPRTLEQALDAFEADPLGRSVMGETMFKSYLAYRRDEWAAYMNHVSDWERERYLRMF